MRSHDRDTVVRLRHQLQVSQSSHRRAVAALDVFRENLLAAWMAVPIIEIAPLLSEIDAIRARLSGEGGAR